MKGRSGAGPGSVRAGGAGGRQGAARWAVPRTARSAWVARSAVWTRHERSEFRLGGTDRPHRTGACGPRSGQLPQGVPAAASASAAQAAASPASRAIPVPGELSLRVRAARAQREA